MHSNPPLVECGRRCLTADKELKNQNGETDEVEEPRLGKAVARNHHLEDE